MKVQHVYLKNATVGDNMEGEVLRRIIEGMGYEYVYGHEPLCDVVCFGGGGMFYDRSHENHRLERRWIEVVNDARKAAAFSIGVQTPLDPRYYGRILGKLDLMTVRDHVSAGRVIGMAGGDVYLMPPLAFLYDFDGHMSDTRDIDLGVVINCQRLTAPPDPSKRWMQRQLLKYLPRDAVIIPAAEPYEEYDRWNVNGLEILHNRSMDPGLFVEQVSRCKVVICGRYHGLITAAMTGTPAIVLCGDARTSLGKVEILSLHMGLRHAYDLPSLARRLGEILSGITRDWRRHSAYMLKVGGIMRGQAIKHKYVVKSWLASAG